MAKSIRTLKADLCDDQVLALCSREARYLFVGLITRADDHGRFRAHPALVRSRVFPYDLLEPSTIAGWLDELEEYGRIRRYEAEGQTYGYLANWSKHQRIDNAARSEFPEPPQSSANLGELPQGGRVSPLDRKGRDRRGKETTPLPPTISQAVDNELLAGSFNDAKETA